MRSPSSQFSDWGRLVAEDGGPVFIDARIEHFYGPGDDDVKFATHLARALLRRTGWSTR